MIKFGCGILMLAFGALLVVWTGYNLFIAPQAEFTFDLCSMSFICGLFFVGYKWVRDGWPAIDETFHPGPAKKKKTRRVIEEEDEEDEPRIRRRKRRRKSSPWPTGLIIGSAAAGCGVFAIVVVVLAVFFARSFLFDRNPGRIQPGNPNAQGNPVQRRPGGPPVNAPPRAHQIIYKVVGNSSPVEDLPRIRQALAAVPGIDPGSIGATADSISFRIDHAHNYLPPFRNA